MQFQSFVTRLEQALPAYAGSVFVTADLAGAQQHAGVRQAGGIYLIAPMQKAGVNQTIGIVSQWVEVRFGVFCMAFSAGDLLGSEGYAAVDAAQPAAFAAMLGWQPWTDADPIQYSGGRLLRLADGWSGWMDEFTTGFLAQSA